MIELGHNSYACNPVFRGSMNRVKVGSWTSIAEMVIFDCGFNHNIKAVTSFPLNKIWTELPHNIRNRGDIIIGNDCYLGERCIIMSGVKIGDGAVVGAGVVIRHDVLPYEVIDGSGKLRFRLKPFQISRMLQIKWWNWTDQKIRENADLLLSENIDEFIAKHYDN